MAASSPVACMIRQPRSLMNVLVCGPKTPVVSTATLEKWCINYLIIIKLTMNNFAGDYTPLTWWYMQFIQFSHDSGIFPPGFYSVG